MAAPDSIEQSLGFLSPMERASNDYKRILDTLHLQQGQQQNNLRAADLGMNMPVYMGMQAASGYPGQGKPQLPNLNNAATPDSMMGSILGQPQQNAYNPGAIGSDPSLPQMGGQQTQQGPQTTPSGFVMPQAPKVPPIPGFDATPPSPPPSANWDKYKIYTNAAQTFLQQNDPVKAARATMLATQAYRDADKEDRQNASAYSKEVQQYMKEREDFIRTNKENSFNGGKPLEAFANDADVRADQALPKDQRMGIQRGDKVVKDYQRDAAGNIVPGSALSVISGGPNKSQVATTTQTVEPAAASNDEIEPARRSALTALHVMGLGEDLHKSLGGENGSQYSGHPAQLMMKVDNLISGIKQTVGTLVDSHKLSESAADYLHSDEFAKDIGWDNKVNNAFINQSRVADIVATIASATTKNHTLGKEDVKLIATQYGISASDPKKFLNVIDDQISRFPQDQKNMADLASPDSPKAASRTLTRQYANQVASRYAEYRGKTAPPVNGKGWSKNQDKNGNFAYVSPDGKQYEEIK